VATLEHSEPLFLKNYVRIVALAFDFRTVPLYSATEFLYHSFNTKLLLLLILIKGSHPSFKALLLYWKSLSALWLFWYANSCKVATRVATSNQSDQRFLVSAKRSCTSLISRCNLLEVDDQSGMRLTQVLGKRSRGQELEEAEHEIRALGTEKCCSVLRF
jgi:hypothetical protein